MSRPDLEVGEAQAERCCGGCGERLQEDGGRLCCGTCGAAAAWVVALRGEVVGAGSSAEAYLTADALRLGLGITSEQLAAAEAAADAEDR